jgi:hypothetical protein
MGKTLNQWGRCQKDIESVMKGFWRWKFGWWFVWLFVCLLKHERKIFFCLWCCVVLCDGGWKVLSWKLSWNSKLGHLKLGRRSQRSKSMKKRTWVNWSWTLSLVIWLWTQSWVTWSWDVDLKDQSQRKKGLGSIEVGLWVWSFDFGLKVGSLEVGTSISKIKGQRKKNLDWVELDFGFGWLKLDSKLGHLKLGRRPQRSKVNEKKDLDHLKLDFGFGWKKLDSKLGHLKLGRRSQRSNSKKKRTWVDWSWTLSLVDWSWTQSWVTCLGTWTSSGALGSKLGHLKVGTWTSSGAVGLKVGSHEVGTSTSSGEVGTSTSEKGGNPNKKVKTLTVCLKTLTKRKLGFRV